MVNKEKLTPIGVSFIFFIHITYHIFHPIVNDINA